MDHSARRDESSAGDIDTGEATMKFQLFQRVILTESIPEESLEIGDVAIVVEHYRTRSGEPDGYEVEFSNQRRTHSSCVSARGSTALCH